jgi:hypothetical protein
LLGRSPSQPSPWTSVLKKSCATSSTPHHLQRLRRRRSARRLLRLRLGCRPLHFRLLYCICFAGAPILYASNRRQCIALSSTEAEVTAASLAATEIAYLREIFRHLGVPRLDPTLHCMSTIPAPKCSHASARSPIVLATSHAAISRCASTRLTAPRQRPPCRDGRHDDIFTLLHTKPLPLLSLMKHCASLMP